MTTTDNNNKSSNRGSKFIKDIGVYAIGNIGSKIITFLMVPLYTYFMPNKSDFGYYDVCLSMCFLLIPFVTLQMRDGAFRFLLDCDDDTRRQRIVTFVTRSMLTTMTLAVLVTIVLSLTTKIGYLGYSLGLLIALALQDVYSQVFRGLGNNRAFVMVGILSAFCIGLFSVLFVAGFGWGIKGVFLANILARIVALIVVEARVRLITRNTRWSINIGDVGRDLLRYSLPLLPGSLCWWITGSSDRQFIKFFLGLDINGLYGVANSADRNRFFSKMFNGYIFLLSAILVGYLFVLKLCYGWLANSYGESLNFIYPLGVSAVIFALAAFFDMGYQCAKDTARTLPAIVLAAVVNVALNFALIKPMGVYGVITTQLVTYVVLVTYRWFDMKRYFTLKISRRVIVPITIVLLSGIPFYLSPNKLIDIAFMIVALMIIAWSCGKDMRDLLISKFTKTRHSTK